MHEGVGPGLDSPLQAQACWFSAAKDATKAGAQLRHLLLPRTVTSPMKVPIAKVLESSGMSLITNVTDVNGGLEDIVQMDCAFDTRWIPYIFCLGNCKQFLLMLQTWESGSKTTSAISGETVRRSRGFGRATIVEGKASKTTEVFAFLISMTYLLQSAVLFYTVSGYPRRTM